MSMPGLPAEVVGAAPAEHNVGLGQQHDSHGAAAPARPEVGGVLVWCWHVVPLPAVAGTPASIAHPGSRAVASRLRMRVRRMLGHRGDEGRG
ncbi:MAG: hypothetical protein ACR2JO_15450 [Mycobacteriales bacterium]